MKKRDYEKEIEILQIRERIANIEKSAATIEILAEAFKTPFVKNLLFKMAEQKVGPCLGDTINKPILIKKNLKKSTKLKEQGQTINSSEKP